MTPIFHPEMLERLSGFFPSTVTIQEPTEIQDPVTGEVEYSWADLAGHVGLNCAHGPSGGREVKRTDQAYVVADYTIAMAAEYPTIDETMRAVVDGRTYDILLVEHNSHGMKTRLSVQEVRL